MKRRALASFRDENAGDRAAVQNLADQFGRAAELGRQPRREPVDEHPGAQRQELDQSQNADDFSHVDIQRRLHAR